MKKIDNINELQRRQFDQADIQECREKKNGLNDQMDEGSQEL